MSVGWDEVGDDDGEFEVSMSLVVSDDGDAALIFDVDELDVSMSLVVSDDGDGGLIFDVGESVDVAVESGFNDGDSVGEAILDDVVSDDESDGVVSSILSLQRQIVVLVSERYEFDECSKRSEILSRSCKKLGMSFKMLGRRLFFEANESIVFAGCKKYSDSRSSSRHCVCSFIDSSFSLNSVSFAWYCVISARYDCLA